MKNSKHWHTSTMQEFGKFGIVSRDKETEDFVIVVGEPGLLSRELVDRIVSAHNLDMALLENILIGPED